MSINSKETGSRKLNTTEVVEEEREDAGETAEETEEGETEEEEAEEGEEEESSEQDEEGSDEEGCAIDLSENEVYRGVCTLFEDDEGNNILEYISLLHTELIGINKSMENLRGIRKDLSRLADVAELLLKGKKDLPSQVPSSSSSVASSSHHDKSDRPKKSSRA